MPLGLVRTTTGGYYFSSGLFSAPPSPAAVAPGNAAGNLLVLLAAWDVSPAITSGGGVVPAGAVGDNVRNWWRYAGDTGSLLPGCRVGVWLCASALAVTRWLSFMPQGYVSSFAFILAEFSGLPAGYWPAIDFMSPAYGASLSSLGAGGIATGADYVFGVGAIGAGPSPPAITAPAGFTSIGSTSQGTLGPNNIQLTAVYQSVAGAGPVPATWRYSAPGMVAACTVGITQASNPPVQINPNFPRVFVEAAFGQNPGDPTAAILDQAYTDISSYAIGPAGQVSISTQGGRAYELSQPESGTITIGLNNQTGAFNPGNTASPFYPNVLPGVPVRISAQFSGQRYPIRQGYVERWPQDWPDMPQWGWSRMVATDAVGVAASVNLPSAVQGEIYADNPYFCFPFSEQYTSSVNSVGGVATLSPVDCDGLYANNTSPANQQSATYTDGTWNLVVFGQSSGYQVVTGQAMGFLGDSGTGMGTTAFGSGVVGPSEWSGPGAIYGPDPSLPAIASGGAGDVSLDFWFIIPTVAFPGSTLSMQLLQVCCTPYLGSDLTDSLGSGVLFTFGVEFLAPSNVLQVYYQGSWNSNPVIVGSLNFNTLYHFMFVFSQGSVTIWDNGGSLAVASPLPGASLVGMGFGTCFAYDGAGSLSNYTIAYASLYPYAVQESRLANHYQAGVTGFSGDTQLQRAVRYIAWSRLNLGLIGPTFPADHLELSAAYSAGGSPLASALNADATSTGGSWLVNECGNLVIVPRMANYDITPQITFGDNPAGGEIPYDPVTGFDFDNTYLRNSARATLTQGPNTLAAQVVRSPASVSQYFQRGPLDQSISAQSAQDAADLANWDLNKYQQPSMRVRALVANPAAYPSAFPAILQTGLGDQAVVNRRPLTQGSYSLPVTVGKIQHDIGPGLWKTTYQMYPYVPDNAILQTDTSGYDVLGSNALAW